MIIVINDINAVPAQQNQNFRTHVGKETRLHQYCHLSWTYLTDCYINRGRLLL